MDDEFLLLITPFKITGGMKAIMLLKMNERDEGRKVVYPEIAGIALNPFLFVDVVLIEVDLLTDLAEVTMGVARVASLTKGDFFA